MLLDEQKRFLTIAAKRRPPATFAASNVSERKGLTPQQRELFLAVIAPDHPDNPFTPKLRVRNYAICRLAYDLGPRAGETLSLKRPQFDDRSAERTITFERRPFDPEDPRSEPALLKTLGRIVPLPDETADALAAWLRDRNGTTAGRRNYPDSVRRTGYIFVSTGGRPLSARRLRDIFATIGRKFPSLIGLTQHVLRADDSERWIERDYLEGRDREESNRAHKERKGWSPKSKMIEHYAGFELHRQPTAEGGAVIAMLLATRTPEVHGVPIGREAIRTMGRAPSGPEARDPERQRAFEEEVARHLTNSFVRGMLGTTPIVSLHYRDLAGIMPVVRTMGTLVRLRMPLVFVHPG